MKPVFILIMVCLSVFVYGQELSAGDKAALKVASKDMYDAGNEKYIIVDAIRDGLITPGIGYGILYMGGEFLRITTKDSLVAQRMLDSPGHFGLKLPPVLKGQYLAKLKRFLIEQQEEPDVPFHINSQKGTELQTILDPASSFRQTNIGDRFQAGLQTMGKRKLMVEFVKDGLVKPEGEFDLVYSDEGITVNNNKLNDKQQEKYTSLFKEYLGIDLEKGKISGHWTSEGGVATYLK
jgi:hypothetical protein